MKAKACCAFFLLLTNFMMFSQDWCLTSALDKRLRDSSPTYLRNIQEQAQKWALHQSNLALQKTSSEDGTYQIPIVIHVMHTGESIGNLKNPNDATLISLIDELNQEFAATWTGNPTTEEGGIEVPFEFVLAQRTLECETTNGINRIDASSLDGYLEFGVAYPGETTGANDTDLKALSIWPNTDYLNIWIVTDIQGSVGGSGIAGYAYYPGTSANIDGVVLNHLYTNWAITHEVGHSFGLRHTFEGADGSNCPLNDDCTVDGDFVCDTDPHLLVSGCPTGSNTCTGTSFDPVNHNFMNYSSCPDRFTEGQKDRMVFMLENYRSGLMSSLGATPTSESIEIPSEPIAATCSPSSISQPDNEFNVGIFNVTLSDLQYTSLGYSGDGFQFYIDNTTAQDCYTQLPQVANLTLEGTYTISVTTGFNPENVRGWIDFNNNGSFEESELVISSNSTGANYETHTDEFTVPANASLSGTLRMRIASDYEGASIPQACSSPSYGQTEDFMVVIHETLSVVEKELTEFSIYPNPAKENLFFKDTLKDVQVFTLDGKEVMTVKNSSHINVSHLAPGFYFLKATNIDGKSTIKKWVKL